MKGWRSSVLFPAVLVVATLMMPAWAPRGGSVTADDTALSPVEVDAATDITLSRPRTLSLAGHHARHPQVAVDDNGNAVFTWVASAVETAVAGEVQVRARSAAGILGAVETLAAQGGDPQVGVGGNGNAVFAWWSLGGNFSAVAYTRARSANGSLGPVQQLAAGVPQVAVDGNGNAVFVMDSGVNNGWLTARVRNASGVLTPVQSLLNGVSASADPRVAVDADRKAIFTWVHKDGTIKTLSRSASGTLSPVQTLSRAGQPGQAPRVAVRADGSAVFVWQRWDGANWRVQTRTRSHSGDLGPIVTLSRSGHDAAAPRVAVDSDGAAVFVWSYFDGSNWRVQLRSRSVDGALGTPHMLSRAGRDASVPPFAGFDNGDSPAEIAVDASGRAIVTWSRFDGAVWRAQARVRAADGGLGPVQNLSPSGEDAREPRVAVDGSGRAVFAWSRFDGANWRIQTRVRSAD